MALLNVIALILLIGAHHIGYFVDGDFRAHWFVLNASAVTLFALSDKSRVKWLRDVISGYCVALLIETIRHWCYDLPTNHLWELLSVGFPVLGGLWRKYRKTTEAAITITILSKAIAWIMDKVFY